MVLSKSWDNLERKSARGLATCPMLTEVKQPTPKEFLYSFISNWSSIISGGLSVPFTWGAIYAGEKWTKLIYGLLAIAGILIASYKIWQWERDELCKTQRELESEVAKQGRPQVTMELSTGGFSELFVCLMNYTASPAINLRSDDIQCGTQILRFDLPTQVSSGFSPTVQAYCPDKDRDSRNWIGFMCTKNPQNKTDLSETILIALRYTDQEAKHEWVTFCKFAYNFNTKKFVIGRQWIESSQPSATEHLPRPILTSPDAF
jgi:hypothetical protein